MTYMMDLSNLSDKEFEETMNWIDEVGIYEAPPETAKVWVEPADHETYSEAFPYAGW